MMRHDIMLQLLLLSVVTTLAQQDDVRWLWSGAVTNQSAVVVLAFSQVPSGTVRVAYSTDATLTNNVTLSDEQVAMPSSRYVRVHLDGLLADTAYHYTASVAGGPPVASQPRRGTFRTVGEPTSGGFSFLASACAHTGSRHPVFTEMLSANTDALFLLHMGDLHYSDIAVDDTALFHAAYEEVMASDPQRQLYAELPIVYMVDDHDFGPNNADKTSPSRAASMTVFRQLTPHYPLPNVDGLEHSFAIGDCYFIVSDVRSNRDPETAPDNASKSMLGSVQKQWLKGELTKAAHYQLVVWVNGVPWLTQSGSDDGWQPYSTERAELDQYIDTVPGLRAKMAIISGDMHGMAFDDGTNSNGIPVIQAAALDRPGSVKGGVYSHGCSVGGGRYARVDVRPGGCFTVSFREVSSAGTGMQWLSWDKCAQHAGQQGLGCDYSAPWVIGLAVGVSVAAAVLLVIVIVVVVRSVANNRK